MTLNWKQDSEFTGCIEIEGLDCLIVLQPRPRYCDRGNWVATIDVKPGGNGIRLNLDYADMWPRYYFDLDRAKAEIEAWLVKRKQVLESPANSP